MSLNKTFWMIDGNEYVPLGTTFTLHIIVLEITIYQM
jgi:hypothetical protein